MKWSTYLKRMKSFYCQTAYTSYFNISLAMKKKLLKASWKLALLSSLIFLLTSTVYGQTPICTGGAPYYVVDLTGSPGGTYVSPYESRQGECCGSMSPDRCVEFLITLDPDAVGVSFDIFFGAEPPGALFYQIDCGPPVSVGDTICLDVGPHTLTFCKPGNNPNSYIIESIAGLQSDPVATWQGCQESIKVEGDIDVSSITWNDITSPNGAYNAYLSCTFGCDSITITPDANAPPVIDYEVCADIPNLVCGGFGDCDTISITIFQTLATEIIPNPAIFCENDTTVLTANINVTGTTFTYTWYDGMDASGNIVGNTTYFSPAASGMYSVIVEDFSSGGCSVDTANVDVTIFPLPSVVPPSLASCAGQPFQINFPSNYTYSWSPPTGLSCTNCSNPTVNINNSTTYSVVVSDTNGCSITSTTTIDVFPNVLASISIDQSISCGDASDGVLSATPSGGTAPYSYLWDTGEQTSVLANAAVGQHTVTITDASGCFVVESVQLTQPPTLNLTGQILENVSCHNFSDGEVAVSVSGGTTPYLYLWDNGGTASTESNLDAGLHFVTVSDANGCQITASYSITEPTLLSTSFMINQMVLCNGGAIGSATVIASGGTPSYTYIWDNGGNSSSVTNLTAGAHTVTIQDFEGCQKVIPFTITQPPILGVAISINQQVSCNGLSDGGASLSVTGGVTPYSFLWDNNETGPTATSLSSGSHTVSITDANGCLVIESFNISQPNELQGTVVINNHIDCFGSNNGSATVSPSGGIAPYTYNWDSGPQTATVNNLNGGPHTITVTDDNGCIYTNTITINEPNEIVLALTLVSDVLCSGNNTGSASATASGGILPYTYLWSNGEQTPIASNLSASTHILTVTDNNGCSSTASISIVQPLPLQTTTIQQSQVSCNGGNDAVATVTATGGTPGYTYLWDNGAVTSTVTNLDAGLHFVSVSDANGCVSTSGLNVLEPPAILLNITNTVPASCSQDSDGGFSISVDGGTPSYNYEWSGMGLLESGFLSNSGSITASNLPAGNYSLTVVDAQNCPQILPNININQPAPVNISVTSVTNADCGVCNGSAQISVSGGNGNLTYQWTTGDSTSNPTNLCPGISYVLAFDLNGCFSYDSIAIQEPPKPTITPTILQNVSCFGGADGSASINAAGGTPGYSVVWSNGTTSSLVNNLTVGVHTVSVTDSGGCNNTASIVITEPAILQASASVLSQVDCFGENTGVAQVTASGGTPGYSFFWDNGETTSLANSLDVGLHLVSITDALGCTTTTSVSLSEPDLLVATTSVINNVSCNGLADGSVSVGASGGTQGYTYNWSNGSIASSANNLAQGTYIVTVIDSQGCSVTASANITEPTLVGATVAITQPISCNGASDGEMTVSSSGGIPPYQYIWDNGSTISSTGMVNEGGYNVTITDSNGCEFLTGGVIVGPPNSITNVGLAQNVQCNGGTDGSAIITASGGPVPYTFSWDNGETSSTAIGLNAGVHIVVITDADGCVDTNEILISEPPVLFSVATPVNATSCFGSADGRATVNTSGGTLPYAYQWDNGETNFSVSNLNAGIHIVAVTDANGCQSTAQVTINEPLPILAATTSITNVSCIGGNDGSATITTTGGTPPFSYLWSNGDLFPTANNLIAGIHFVTITDNNNCTSTTSVTLTEPPILTVSTSGNVNVSCFDGTDGSFNVDVLGGTPPYLIDWSGPITTNSTTLPSQGSANATNLEAGSYQIIVTDVNGCQSSTSNILLHPTEIQTVETSNIASTCGACNGVAGIMASGGAPPYNYLWSNGSIGLSTSNLCPGVNNVTVTDQNGCIKVANIVTSTITTLTISNVITTIPSCNGGSDGSAEIQVQNGVYPYSYQWSNGIPDTDSIVVGLAAGTYFVSVTSGLNCLQSSVVVIGEPTQLVASVSQTQLPTCVGSSNGEAIASPSGATPPYNYLWDTGETTSTSAMLGQGNHFVTISDANGCTLTESVSMSDPTPLLLNSVIIDNVSCFGQSDGVIGISINGGQPPYQYFWDGPTTGSGNQSTTGSSQINGLAAGAYTLSITDANGCVTSSSAAMNQPDLLVSSLLVNNAVFCNGGSDGSATVNATGGTSPYFYTWSNGEITQTASALSAGNHTVLVTDNNGCTFSANLNITEPTALTSTTNIAQQLSCFGGSDGVGSVSVSNGTSPYTYLWDNGSTTNFSSNLAVGTYLVTITDNNGCTRIDDVTITEPMLLITSSIQQQAVSCFGQSDGSVGLTISGGTQPYSYSWSGPQSGSSPAPVSAGISTISSVSTGSYSITVTDSEGCLSSTSIFFSEPTLVVLTTAVLVNVSCTSSSDGRAEVVPSGGISPYSYLWDTGESNNIAIMLNAGTHTVQVADANNCISSATILISEPTPLSSTINVLTDVNCTGDNDGSAEAIITGGTPPYNYLWDNGEQGNIATSLNFGNHVVTITDANNCLTTGMVSINEPVDLVTSYTVSEIVSCHGDSNGVATVSASGGVPPYQFLWANGLTTTSSSNLSAGTYLITITDSNGCIDVNNVIVEEPFILVATSTNTMPVSCSSGSDGQISGTVNGGISPYNLDWTGPINGNLTQNNSGSFQINNIPEGAYSITVTDNEGCESVTFVQVVEPENFAISTIAGTDVTCTGASDGTASVIATGGTPPYSYLWNNGPSTFAVTNLPAGIHEVLVSDALGCTISSSISLGEPQFSRIASTLSNVNCFGGNDGSATISMMGGALPYEYAWDNGESSNTAIALDAGIHIVTITDANGCSQTDNIFITEPPLLVGNLLVNNNISCNGGTDGSASVTVSGGSGGYTYSWSNGATITSATGLPAGSISIVVTDILGCSISLSETITQPQTVSLSSMLLNNIDCFEADNGSAQVFANGGFPPYSFLWSNGNSTDLATNLEQGIHFITVVDANSCMATSSITISQPDSLAIFVNVNQNVSCNGYNDGSAVVSATGGTAGYVFEWSNGFLGTSVNNLNAGTYTITVTDNNNCMATISVNITAPTELITAASLIQDVSCYSGNNGSAVVSISGGTPNYSILWSNGETQQSATNLIVGNHIVTVTDANGCMSMANINIQEPPSLQTQVFVDQPINCNGGSDGSFTSTVSGGSAPYTYLWDNGSTDSFIDNQPTGSATLTITDSNGCFATANANIGQPTSLAATASLVSNVGCFGESSGAAQVQPSGGTPPYLIEWSNGVTIENQQGMVFGTYTVTITDSNNCIATDNVSIVQPDSLIIDVSILQNIACAGGNDGAAVVSASGGSLPYHFEWDNNSTNLTANNLSSGTHFVTVTDSNNCLATGEILILEPDPLNGITEALSVVSCHGGQDGSAQVEPFGGISPFSFLWDSGESDTIAYQLDAGIHWVTITDANNCFFTISVEIEEPAPIIITPVIFLGISCVGNEDGVASVNVTGGNEPYTYFWDTGETGLLASNLAAGNHSVTVHDQFGCVESINLFVPQKPPLSIESAILRTLDCAGDSIGIMSVGVSGGTDPYSYQWSNDDTLSTISGLGAGMYTVTVTDARGCTITTNVTLNEPSSVVGEVFVTNTICYGDENGVLTFSASGGDGGYTYSINGFDFSPNDVFPGLPAGVYNVAIMDASGCVWQEQQEILDPPQLLVEATPKYTELLLGEMVDLEAYANFTDSITYSWSPTTGLDCWDCQFPQAFPFQTTSYIVKATSEIGCTVTDTVVVVVDRIKHIFIPNAFTPNEDGINDIFYIFGGLSAGQINTFSIHDRWGETVFRADNFQPNDPSFGWDGRFRGKPMNPGVFVYYAQIEFIDGTKIEYKGDLTLLR